MGKDTRPWAFEAAVEVSGGLNIEFSRPFALARIKGQARHRGKKVDESTLTHHQNPAWPGDSKHRIWKAKEAR